MSTTNQPLSDFIRLSRFRLWLAALLLAFSQFAIATHLHDLDDAEQATETCQVCWHAQHVDLAGLDTARPAMAVYHDENIRSPHRLVIIRHTSVIHARGPPHTVFL